MTFTTPVEDRYFEDYVPGAVREFGGLAGSIRLPIDLCEVSDAFE